MRYEVGWALAQAELSERNARGEKVPFWDLHESFNCSEVEKLLENRIHAQREFEMRQNSRREMLERAEKEGHIVFFES